MRNARFARTASYCSRTLTSTVDSRDSLAHVIGELLQTVVPAEQGIRLLGVSLSGLDELGRLPGGQLSLFAE